MSHKPRRLAVLAVFAAILTATAATEPRPPSRAAAVLAHAPGAAPAPQQEPQQQPPQAPQPDPQQKPPQQPTFRAGVNFVRVDVIVSDRDGGPVADLQQADFEVSEDGKPQAIETFRFISVDGNPAPGEPAPKEIRTDYDEESEAARDDVRLFAIFLDDYHVRRGASMSVKEPLIRFIQNQLGPTDMVGVMFPLTPVAAVRMTRNRDELVRVIENFEGRKYDYRPRNEFEDKYAMYPATVVERVRNQVSLSALRSLVLHMGGLREGRKAVVLVSEGFTNILPPQLRDPVAAFPGLGNPARGSAAEGNEREEFFANTDIQSDLREVYGNANRSNTTIYSLDPRGLTPFEFDIDQGVGMETDRRYLQSTTDTLRVLAEETDGRAIVGRNDLDNGLRQVVRDSSAYYLIGYNSSEPRADGKFHEIKVRVKRPGVQVRARKGYWALTEAEMDRSMAPAKPVTPPEVTRALGEIGEVRRERFIRTWVGTTRGENGMTRVTFVWEPLPAPAGTERAEATGVQLLAAGSGANRPYFRGRVPDAATEAPGEAGAPGPRRPHQVTFDAAPGPLQLRVSVEGADAQVIDTDIREVKVPDLTAPQVSIGTPAVFRAGNAREFNALTAEAAPVPTTAREFRRTDRLLVRFEAYMPGGATPKVTARVLNRAGKAMADLQVRTPEAGGQVYQLDVPLAGFAAGEYLLEVKANGAEGEATEMVGIRITA